MYTGLTVYKGATRWTDSMIWKVTTAKKDGHGCILVYRWTLGYQIDQLVHLGNRAGIPVADLGCNKVSNIPQL